MFNSHFGGLGGQKAIRPYWRDYFADKDILIYVVDAADPTRFNESKEELQNVYRADPRLQNAPLLIMANKNDLLAAVSVTKVAQVFASVTKNNRHFLDDILAVSAKSGRGLNEAMEKVVNWIDVLKLGKNRGKK